MYLYYSVERGHNILEGFLMKIRIELRTHNIGAEKKIMCTWLLLLSIQFFYKPIFEHTLIVKKSTLYVQPQEYVDSIFQGFYSL
jgi:hypothetical protein